MKSAEELAQSAFKWAENQAKQIQASIDAGNLEGEALENAKETVSQFEELKKSFEETKKFCNVKNFSAENTETIESEDALDFAIIRKLVSILSDDGQDHTELFDAIKGKLIECGKDPNILTAVINHIAKLKGLEYSESDDTCYSVFDQLVTDEIQNQVDNMEVTPENVFDLICANQSKVVRFSGEDSDGIDLVESGKKFLEQIKERIMSSDDPDTEQVAEYDKAINALSKFIDDSKKEVKEFNADETDSDQDETEVESNPEDKSDEVEVEVYPDEKGEVEVEVYPDEEDEFE